MRGLTAVFTLFPLLALLTVILVVVAVVQRVMKKGEDKGGGADIIAYLVLAVAMAITGFALVQLANTAFPGDRFVFDPAEDVATSLAALVVAGPFLVYFWRRQAPRRATYPASAGWTLYLSLIEVVFTAALIITATMLISGLVTGDGTGAWASTLVFGAIVAFHDLATRRTPPRSDSAELPRVIGAALGLITASIGLAGSLAAIFSLPFASNDFEFMPWVAMLAVGAPVWLYRWFRAWEGEPDPPRVVWTVLVSIGTLATMVGSATAIVVLAIQYVFTDAPPAGAHFDPVPIFLAIFLTTLIVWLVHRRSLGSERTNPVRAYEYALAGIGLGSAVIGAIGLTVIAFDNSVIVGSDTADVVGVTAGLVVGLAMWQIFSRRSRLGDIGTEATAWPRRLYSLGLGVVAGLIAAGSLITTIFILLRRLMTDSDGGSVLIPLAMFVYTGLVAWYLLATYARERESIATEAVIAPFEVMIMCGHPGPIATRLPNQARLRVFHRGDGQGVIDDSIADAIVLAVGNQPSMVWVDDDGIRVAPKLAPN